MTVELTIPAVGESVTEALISRWLKAEGDFVERDEPVAELETDKVTLELPAPAAGRLSKILLAEGTTAAIGDVIGHIEEGARPAAATKAKSIPPPAKPRAAPAPTKTTAKATAKTTAHAKPAPIDGEPRVMPAARRLLEQQGIAASEVTPSGPGSRVLKEDVKRHLERAPAKPPAPRAPEAPAPAPGAERLEEAVPMTPIRKRIAERLVKAQQTAALLTTFNEIDMSAVIALRKQYQEAFTQRHGVKLGFMSFFVKACVDALRQFPQLNAEIREDQIVYRNYYDIGIAVSTDRGLLVPVLRSTEQLGFAEIELGIADFSGRARDGKIKLEEIEGGTFTITNGGIFGSMLSTPIINPPQSGVLGLHAIQDRPVAIEGRVEIRPVMYVALTYDHRIVDGREAVTFLRRIKEAIEEPSRMLLEV